MALLEIHDLHTFFKTKKGIVKAVNGVSYSVEPGKTLGVVGESGSGKSVSAMSILKLLDGNGYIDSGEIIFDGKNLADVSVKDMCKIRGNEISVIFQEPMTSLNPIFTVERQLSEPFIIHQGMNKKEAAEKVVEMLKDVRIPNPEAVAKQYPHQLSGGMRQRVMIAMALACRPKLLIADEPTTALDVTIQAQILKLMNDLKKEKGTSILFITHDLGVINEMADDVAVMYCGQVVEKAPVRSIFGNAQERADAKELDQNIVINKDHAKEDGSKGCNSLAHSLAPPSSVFALSISSSITSPQVLRSMGLFSFFSMYTHNAIRQPNTKKPPGAWFIRLMRSMLSGMMVIPIQVPLPKISRTEDMSSMVRM